MSSPWSIAELLRYQRTRFPLTLFLPLALFLTFAASTTDESTPFSRLAVRCFLATVWLFQFRLGDDLADRERDRQDHPDRVLVRADWRPFALLLTLLTIGNALLTWLLLPPPRSVEFVGLVGALLCWYAATGRWRLHPLLQCGGVLLKYPAFVYLLAEPSPDASPWMLPAILILVYACFLAHEILHDRRLWTATGSTDCLLIAMLLMIVAGAIAAADAPWWHHAVTGAGVLVLGWLFVRFRQRRPPGLWPRAVFPVSCGWIASAWVS